MNNLRILFLGWEFSPDNDQYPETNSYSQAKALASEFTLSLILPKANPELHVKNIQQIGLNQVKLSEDTLVRNGPKIQPFAESAYIRSGIALYGSPDIPENQRSYSTEKTILPVSSLGTSSALNNSTSPSKEAANFFDQVNWNQLQVDAQIIQYARFVTRLATNSTFDVIFASNWLTYLAGNELHLITGKPLAIQINTLSQDHRDLNSQGWRYELEKMAIERANHVFTASLEIAKCLEAAYPLTASKVYYLEDATFSTDLDATETNDSDLWQNKEDRELTNYIPIKKSFNLKNQAAQILQVLTEPQA